MRRSCWAGCPVREGALLFGEGFCRISPAAGLRFWDAGDPPCDEPSEIEISNMSAPGCTGRLAEKAPVTPGLPSLFLGWAQLPTPALTSLTGDGSLSSTALMPLGWLLRVLGPETWSVPDALSLSFSLPNLPSPLLLMLKARFKNISTGCLLVCGCLDQWNSAKATGIQGSGRPLRKADTTL